MVSFLDTATTHLGMDLEIGEVPITPRSPFAGKTIENSRIRQDRGVIILAIKREAGMRFNPAPDDRIEAGDFLIAMGEPQQLRELEQTAGDASMKIVSAAEMREIDRATSERFGVPSLTLMENAGVGRRPFHPLRLPASGARWHCLRQGQQRRRWIRRGPQAGRSGPRRARFAVVGSRRASRRCGGDVSEHDAEASAMNIAPLIVREASALDSSDAAEIFAADVLVDAILGTGFRPPVSPLYAAAIAQDECRCGSDCCR